MNDIIDFLQKLAISRHGSLEKARFIISREEINMRCCYCLDSIKDSRKRRFYYSLKSNVFYCHNCQRKGPFAKLLHDFKNLSGINYEKIEKEIGMQKVREFIDGKHEIQDQQMVESDWVLEFPDGTILDELFKNKNYKKLPAEDKIALLKAVNYIQGRGVKKEWFHYFYFVFPGEPLDQYILTLFEHNGDWVWSGRKIDETRPGPKYNHMPGFPFHTALGFANEVSTAKGTNIFVVESWWSALLLNQANLNSVCVFGLQNMSFSHSPLKIFQKKYDLIWVPDNDASFGDFAKVNIESARKMKVLIVPDKDVADYAVRQGDKFRKQFLTLPIRSLFNQEILNNVKTLI